MLSNIPVHHLFVLCADTNDSRSGIEMQRFLGRTVDTGDAFDTTDVEDMHDTDSLSHDDSFTTRSCTSEESIEGDAMWPEKNPTLSADVPDGEDKDAFLPCHWYAWNVYRRKTDPLHYSFPKRGTDDDVPPPNQEAACVLTPLVSKYKYRQSAHWPHVFWITNPSDESDPVGEAECVVGENGRQKDAGELDSSESSSSDDSDEESADDDLEEEKDSVIERPSAGWWKKSVVATATATAVSDVQAVSLADVMREQELEEARKRAAQVPPTARRQNGGGRGPNSDRRPSLVDGPRRAQKPSRDTSTPNDDTSHHHKQQQHNNALAAGVRKSIRLCRLGGDCRRKTCDQAHALSEWDPSCQRFSQGHCRKTATQCVYWHGAAKEDIREYLYRVVRVLKDNFFYQQEDYVRHYLPPDFRPGNVSRPPAPHHGRQNAGAEAVPRAYTSLIRQNTVEEAPSRNQKKKRGQRKEEPNDPRQHVREEQVPEGDDGWTVVRKGAKK